MLFASVYLVATPLHMRSLCCASQLIVMWSCKDVFFCFLSASLTVLCLCDDVDDQGRHYSSVSSRLAWPPGRGKILGARGKGGSASAERGWEQHTRCVRTFVRVSV